MELLLLLMCFGIVDGKDELKTESHLVPMSNGLNIYLNNATKDVGKAFMEQASHTKMNTLVYIGKMWSKESDVFRFLIPFDSSLYNKRIVTNLIFGSVTFRCGELQPASMREECESMNSDLTNGLSTSFLKNETAEVLLEIVCTECLAMIAAIASTSERSHILVTMSEPDNAASDYHLKLGHHYTVDVYPEPEKIEAVMSMKSSVEIKRDFIPYHNFLLRLTYSPTKIRYTRDEYLVSDLRVEANPWKAFYNLNFGDLLRINLTLHIAYNAKFILILECGGGLIVASKPYQSNGMDLKSVEVRQRGKYSIEVKKDGEKEVIFVMGPDRNHMPRFGCIKIRKDPAGTLVWKYMFGAEISGSDNIERLVHPQMALGDLDGADVLDQEGADSRDYGLTSRGQDQVFRRRSSRRKAILEPGEEDFGGSTENYETSGDSGKCALLVLIIIIQVQLFVWGP